MIRRQNIYFGPDSVAKINPKAGRALNKVDSVDDFLAVMYAFFLDALGGVMLTHCERPPYIIVTPPNPKIIAGRLYVLKRLKARIPGLKNTKGLDAFIDKMIQLILQRRKQEAYQLMEEFARRSQTYDLYLYVMNKIQEVKKRPKIYGRC